MPRSTSPVLISDRNGKLTTVHRAVPEVPSMASTLPPPVPSTLATTSSAHRVNSPAGLALTATLDDLHDEHYDPFYDYAEDPGWRDEVFTLTEIDLSAYASSTSPSDYVSEMDFEDDEEADAEFDAFDELRQAIEDGDEIPPVIAVRYADGTTRLLDGNHRAGLALYAGKRTAYAYLRDFSVDPKSD